MISQQMYLLGGGGGGSSIRELVEYGKKRAAIVGKENVFDFSMGNPNVPAPECVKKAIIDLVNETDPALLHGYTSAPGEVSVRQTIAESWNRRFATSYTKDNIFITMGAAASLMICLKALCVPGDEFVAFAPFFPEYKTYVEGVGAKLVVVPANIEDFQINFSEFEKSINKNTKGVIINSPNNPSGIIYSQKTIIKLADLLDAKSKEYGHPIYLISDDPYREIVFKNAEVPLITKYYKNTFICYSYSKSLSLPGERLGFILLPSEMADFEQTFAAISGAGRALGYVNAPSLFQRVIARCVDETADISIYEKNKEILYNALISMGYKCVEPGGTFYLFPQSLEPDAAAFCKKAMKYDLLIVPGDAFYCPGHVRIAYCVKTDQVERSLQAFEKLAKEYL